MEFLIKCGSVEESNLFLRKLWSELNTINKIGWNFMPHKEGNMMYIGISNFGAVSFDYIKKGCINKLFVDYPDNGEYAEKIKKAVEKAKKNSLSYYTVIFNFKNECVDFKFKKMCSNDVLVSNENDSISIAVNIEAYSDYDLKNIVNYISDTILAILLEYTNLVFKMENIVFKREKSEFVNQTNYEPYSFDWVDLDEIPRSTDSHVLLPKDFFYLISCVVKNDINNENIRLILNSCRMLLASQKINAALGRNLVAGESEMLDSLVVSSIEPLSCVFNKEKIKCTECGNMKYSIVAKMRALLERYTNESFAKYFCKTFYTERSKLLHEGVFSANGFFFNVNFPMIDPESRDKMITPRFEPNFNLKDYSAFLFRKTVNDLIENNFVVE